MAETLDSSDPTPMEEAPITVTEDQTMSEPQNPKTTTDSDSDSESDSDSDDEAQDNLQLQTLETELSSNPGNYDAHVQVFHSAQSFISNLYKCMYIAMLMIGNLFHICVF